MRYSCVLPVKNICNVKRIIQNHALNICCKKPVYNMRFKSNDAYNICVTHVSQILKDIIPNHP